MVKETIRLILMTRSNSASGIGPSRPITRLATPMPAQLINTRAAPWALAAVAIAAAAEGASGTSQVTATPPISGATACANLVLRSHTATLAPAMASRRAVAAPNPDAPPVTIAARSFNCIGFLLIFLGLRRYHVGVRRGQIKRFNRRPAVVEHRALVDRSLVGDFATIDRERRIEQERAGNPRRRTGRCRLKRRKSLPEGAAHGCVPCEDGDVVGRQRGIDQAA